MFSDTVTRGEFGAVCSPRFSCKNALGNPPARPHAELACTAGHDGLSFRTEKSVSVPWAPSPLKTKTHASEAVCTNSFIIAIAGTSKTVDMASAASLYES